MAYSSEFLQFIAKTRKEGAKWKDISALVYERFGLLRTPENLRATHEYHNLKACQDDNIDETQAYKDSANARRMLYKKTSEISALRNMVSDQDQFVKELSQVVSKLKHKSPKVRKPRKSKKKPTAILELMLADLHIGLSYGDEFNYVKAEERMTELANVVKGEIERTQKIYNIEKLMINSLGDLIHNEMLHPVDSVRSSEGPNPQQAVEAIRILYNALFIPLIETGVMIEVNCVAGNHDRIDVKRPVWSPGISSWSWVIYHSLQSMFKNIKCKKISFNIAEDSYLVVPVFGDNMLITHGDELKSPTPAVIENYIHSRSKQMNLKIDYLRMGHYHEYKMFGRGRFILTDSFCGQDHYAKKMGFSSAAGQVINHYVETDERPTTFYRSFPIYLP